jgi:hypothetical protein
MLALWPRMVTTVAVRNPNAKTASNNGARLGDECDAKPTGFSCLFDTPFIDLSHVKAVETD